MKLKMRFGLIIVVVFFLGTYLTNTIAPNQQIVIQFSNQNVSSELIESSIYSLTKRLNDLGVKHIEIGNYHKGQLKITYYSEADVIRIQSILNSTDDIVLENTDDKPSNESKGENEQYFELNISEIQETPLNNWDFEGIEITELNHKSDRYYFPKVKIATSNENLCNSNEDINSRLRISKTFHFNKGKFAYKIPEVRAGPISVENS